MLIVIGHVTENAVNTGNDLFADHGRYVLCVFIQQIVMQNYHVALDRLIRRIILNGQRVNRCIEIIIIIEICNQVLQALVACIIRNAVYLIAKQHTVGQLNVLIILSVINHLHADTRLRLYLHNEEDVVLFLGFAREAIQLIRRILQEHVVLGIFLCICGNGSHLIKDAVRLLRALQAVIHRGDLTVVLIQIIIQLVQLALQLVILLLQLGLLGLGFGDQTALYHGFGNGFTVFILTGDRCGRALIVSNLLLQLGNTQLFQLAVHHTDRNIDCLQALIGCKRIAYDLVKADRIITNVHQQLGDHLIGGTQCLDLLCDLVAFVTQRGFFILQCT